MQLSSGSQCSVTASAAKGHRPSVRPSVRPLLSVTFVYSVPSQTPLLVSSQTISKLCLSFWLVVLHISISTFCNNTPWLLKACFWVLKFYSTVPVSNLILILASQRIPCTPCPYYHYHLSVVISLTLLNNLPHLLKKPTKNRRDGQTESRQTHRMQQRVASPYGIGWFRGSAVERWSLAGELSLSCARPTADGWPLMWVNRPL